MTWQQGIFLKYVQPPTLLRITSKIELFLYVLLQTTILLNSSEGYPYKHLFSTLHKKKITISLPLPIIILILLFYSFINIHTVSSGYNTNHKKLN